MIWNVVSAYRALTGRQLPSRTSVPGAPSLSSMLWEEVILAARSVLHPVKLASAAMAAVGVALLLGPTTPGPVIGTAGRTVTAIFLGMLSLLIAHRLLRDQQADERLRGAAVVVGSATIVTVGTGIVALVLGAATGFGDPGVQGDPLVSVDPLLLRGSLLLGLAVLAARLGDRFAWPTSLLVLGLGMALGDDGFDLVSLDDPLLVQGLGVLALIIVLFDGGLGTSTAQLRDGLGPGLALASVGVAITTGLTAAVLVVVADVDLTFALLVAAIVASTDASAVLAVLRQVPLPRRLASVLTVESGINDPVAVLLTVGLLATLEGAAPAGGWLGFAAIQVIAGLFVGVAAGWGIAFLMRLAGLPGNPLRALLALAGAGVTYGLAAGVGGSGFLAVYVAGAIVSADPRVELATVRPIVDAFTRTAELALFLLLGLLVFPSELPATAGIAAAVTAALLLVARPLASIACLAAFGFTRRETAAVSWLGMRGAVPIVMATLAFSSGLDEAPLLFNIVFVVVLTSTVVQGLTAKPLLSRLQLPEDEPDLPELSPR